MKINFKPLLMKKILLALLLISSFTLKSQVPNGGFESWTSGNPDSWSANNFPGFAVPITQATPPYSGSLAVKGEVVNTVGGPLAPLLTSTDASFNGFPVSQAYANFSFYYKIGATGSTVLSVSAIMYDAGGNFVGGGGNLYNGSVNVFTLSNIPIYYTGTNPVECVITFVLSDTVAGNPNIGDFFIADALMLSGSVGIQNASSQNDFLTLFPNPAHDQAVIAFISPYSGNAELIIYDVNGKAVKQLSTFIPKQGLFEWIFSVNELPQAIYHARILCGGYLRHIRLIKN